MALNRTLIVSALLTGLAGPALAHTGHDGGAGFAIGFAHPFGGLDHLLAMACIGLWAVQQHTGRQQNRQPGSRRALILLPAAFVLAMALGFGLAFAGLALPAVETGITLSVLVLGLLVAFAARPPLVAALGLTAIFALFHGHAHGSELPQAGMAGAYAAGMLLATALLHGLGLLGATLAQQIARPSLTRAAGAATALAGLAILIA